MFSCARASFTTTHNSGVYYIEKAGNLEILNLNKWRKILDKPMSLILLAAEKFSDANLKVQNVPAEV